MQKLGISTVLPATHVTAPLPISVWCFGGAMPTGHCFYAAYTVFATAHSRYAQCRFLFGVSAAQCPLGIAFMPPTPFSRRLILATLNAVAQPSSIPVANPQID
ncbi:hypothetical protein [Mobiluncus curtisii]|uniref:hypothetical protein n=1 Tax=Mobiluncus curtisii TaxID=2051 RepID=UPI002430AF5D|nr:hypothetical protein [Mobiluncus curtisii]